MELRNLGKVRRFNKSFYIPIPKALAREKGIDQNTRFQLFDDGDAIVTKLVNGGRSK